MSYPAYPPQQQPYYPPQGQPYPPQYPPQAQPYPPQGQQPYYPPQAQQYPPQQPVQQGAQGSIADFFEQPAASGKSISFDKKAPGTSYTGMVARTLTKADVIQQTEMHTKRLATHPDGRPKYTMVIPLLLQPSAEFPDGRAAWYCKHNEKPELERAMEAAGLRPGTPPEQGAIITITYTGDRPVPGMSPQKVKSVTYQRPPGASGQPEQAAIVTEPASIPQPPALADPGSIAMAQQHGSADPQYQQAMSAAMQQYPQPQQWQAQAMQPAPGTAYQQPPQQVPADGGQWMQHPPGTAYQAPPVQFQQSAPPPQQFEAQAQQAMPQQPPAPLPQQVAGLTEAQQQLLAQLTGPPQQ